ncbi:MAG: SIR2 family protein, partial [Bacteroidota bacterium]
MDNELAFIVDSLARGACLVIIGPDLLRAQGSQMPLRKELHAQKVKGSNGTGDYLEYYEQEEVYLFQNPKQQTRFFYALEDFYKASNVDKTAYQQLGELPIPLFLNGSPDLILRDSIGETASFAYYHKGIPDADVPPFSVKNPLVYNLLGTIEQQESLVLTHDDLFQYLERIFSEGQVPQAILDALFGARCLLFLGVGFDKWYVQLLLRLLKVTDERFARYASPRPDNS